MWRLRIGRATELARVVDGAAQLLTQYAGLLDAQRACYDALHASGGRLTGSLERDLGLLRRPALEMFGAIASVAPAQAMQGAPAETSALEALLRESWHTAAPPFLARVVLQAYMEALVAANKRPDRHLDAPAGCATCPFCGGLPQVAALVTDSSAGGAGRVLICATCATEWPLRRILCAACGEEDEHRLKYFRAPEFDHVRVDTCDSCHHYIKAVDLTRLGVAVPLVDDVASAALDLWAADRGCTKVTPNLIGL